MVSLSLISYFLSRFFKHSGFIMNDDTLFAHFFPTCLMKDVRMKVIKHIAVVILVNMIYYPVSVNPHWRKVILATWMLDIKNKEFHILCIVKHKST